MAWYAVLTAATMLAVIVGMLVNGMTAFIVPMETADGWPRADIAGINAFGLIGVALGGVVLSRLTAVLGMRGIALLAASVMGSCLVAASFAMAPWVLQLIFFVAGMLAGGTLFAPIFAYVGNWFPRRAGLAIGFAAAGQAVGQGGMPYLASHLIEAYGWRQAMFLLGAGTLALLLPMASALRPAPATPAAAVPGSALRTVVAIPLLSAAVFLCCACMAVPLMHLMPLIQSLCIASTDAGQVMFAMLLAAIAGRIAYGRLCDVIGSARSWFVASALQTVGVLAFTQFDSLRGFLLFSIVYGFAYAGVMTSLLVTTRALTPAQDKPFWMGIVLAFAWLGHAFGGFQGAYAFELTDGYGAGFAAAAAAGVANLAIVGLLIYWTNTGPRPPALAVQT